MDGKPPPPLPPHIYALLLTGVGSFLLSLLVNDPLIKLVLSLTVLSVVVASVFVVWRDSVKANLPGWWTIGVCLVARQPTLLRFWIASNLGSFGWAFRHAMYRRRARACSGWSR